MKKIQIKWEPRTHTCCYVNMILHVDLGTYYWGHKNPWNMIWNSQGSHESETYKR